MFDSVKKMLKACATPAEIREQIATLEKEQPAARRRLTDLHATRGRVLVEGTDRDLDSVEREIATASRDVERAEAAVGALRQKLEEAEQHEWLAAVNAKLDSAEERRSKMVERIRTEYAPAVDTIVSVLLEFEVAEQAIAQANEAARKAGVDRAIDSVARSFPSEAGFTRNPTRDVTLVSAEDFTRKIWPPDASSSARYGEVVERLRAAS